MQHFRAPNQGFLTVARGPNDDDEDGQEEAHGCENQSVHGDRGWPVGRPPRVFPEGKGRACVYEKYSLRALSRASGSANP